jgi:hypothetical protein
MILLLIDTPFDWMLSNMSSGVGRIDWPAGWKDMPLFLHSWLLSKAETVVI